MGDKYGRDEEGVCGSKAGTEAGHRTVSGDEGGKMSGGDKGLASGKGPNHKMSSTDTVSNSGKQA